MSFERTNRTITPELDPDSMATNSPEAPSSTLVSATVLHLRHRIRVEGLRGVTLCTPRNEEVGVSVSLETKTKQGTITKPD